MKTQELMRFDWVCLEDDNTPRQVDWIRSGEVGLFWNKIVTPPYLKPISLTPKILKKNGFTHSFGDSDFYDYEKWEKKVDDKTIRVIKDHDGWFCRVDDIKLTRSMGIASSVHTMQHIIRTGGIEKTIEL